MPSSLDNTGAVVSNQKPLLLSVALITLNEETNLPRCLQSVRELASEIVVIDSGSTDKTAAAAAAFGATFASVPWQGYVAQKNTALECCTNPWVLCLDADEALTPELIASIRAAFEGGEPNEDGFLLNRRTFYLGAWIWHSWYPEWRLRLVRKSRARWQGQSVHEELTVSGTMGRLKGDLLHYPFQDFHDHLKTTIHYARLTAESYAREGKKFHWHLLLLSPWAAFFKHLLVKQGSRDGWRGWLIAFSKFINVFAKYAFLLEMERRAGERQPTP